MTVTGERHSYVLLDGMRGVAALAVAVLHMPRVFDGFTLPNAHLAVDFFLQLSGFIVAYAYADRIANGMRFRDFAWRRVNRLYPAYLIGALLGLVVAVAAVAFGGSGLTVDWSAWTLACAAIPNLVMLPQAFCGTDLLFPLNPPMWSIFYEVLINFAFFAVAAVLIVWRRSLLISALLLVALVVLTYPGTLDVGYSWSTFGVGLVRMTFSFAVGLTIYGLARAASRAPRGSSLVTVALLAALAVVLAVQVEAYWYELMMIVVVFPLIVLVGSKFNPTHRGLLWLCAQLGAASYMLYVIHKPLYQLLYAATLRVAPGMVDALGAVLGVVMLATISLVAWGLARVYEPPARQLLNRQFQRIT